MNEKDCNVITEGEIHNLLPVITPDSNKYSRGRLLLIAGSYGLAGAAVMAARAALRSGVGYLNIACSKKVYNILSAQVPEAVFTIYDPEITAQAARVIKKAMEKADACVAGCGLGELRTIVMPILYSVCDKPLLVDADGLNWVADQGPMTWKSSDVVMTPHSGELSRLCKEERESIEENRVVWAARTAGEKNVTLLLKGPVTIIAHPDKDPYKNIVGTPGMGRAGSGDVLSGIIGALMAQGLDGFHSAICGAWIHGRAGELAAEKYGIRSMLPTDMVEEIAEVIQKLDKFS